ISTTPATIANATKARIGSDRIAADASTTQATGRDARSRHGILAATSHGALRARTARTGMATLARASGPAGRSPQRACDDGEPTLAPVPRRRGRTGPQRRTGGAHAVLLC